MKLEVIMTYYDKELKRALPKGYKFVVSPERADELLKNPNKLVKVIEEPKVEKAIVEPKVEKRNGNKKNIRK